LAGRSGDIDAEADFEEFFDTTWDRMVSMSTRMGLSREDAEDVALDAMAIVYDRWKRVRPLPFRQAWALKVASNRARRQLRRAARPKVTFFPAPASVEDEVTARLAVRDIIAGLPRRQRQVVVLRYLADMPEDQVAQVLGLDVGTVKQHSSRGRARLHEWLQHGPPGDIDAD
jgi:RNA polymerase sigma factor (sigma-70 family)